MASQRMQTGIPGLDEIFGGGLLPNQSYLLTGSAGTGKTILALQWLHNGILQGEKCLYITLIERVDAVRRNVADFKWVLDQLDMVDLSPQGTFSKQPEASPIEEYLIFSPNEVEHLGTWESIYQAIAEKKPSRLVIDSATQLSYLSTDEYQFRKQILNLIAYLSRLNITTFLLFEPSELEHEISIGLAADSIIQLRMDISKNRAIGLRNLQVNKLRGSDFLSGFHSFQITEKGIHIYPHRVEAPGNARHSPHVLASSITALDALLHGGLALGSTTMISGPTGVGKSTLGMQFLSNRGTQKSRSILYTFEESIASVVSRCEHVGMRITEQMDQDVLRIVRVNPIDIYPDQFLEMVRHAVEREHFNRVMIDSLQDYKLAMDEYGTLLFHVQNLVTYLSRKAVTTLLINEVDMITGGLKVTALGVSHLADNVLLLRYAEDKGQIIKVIACLKKRLSDFESEFRLFSMDSNGIAVGHKLGTLRGMLTGHPVPHR